MKHIILLKFLYPLFILTSSVNQIAMSEENRMKLEFSSLTMNMSSSLLGYDIWIVPDTGGIATQITNLPDTDEFNPCWSPDGTTIGHDVLNDDFHHIYFTDIETGESSFFCVGNDCNWSPSGSLLAVHRHDIGGIWMYPMEGGSGWPVEGDNNGYMPRWSPDGNMISFIAPYHMPGIPGDLFALTYLGGTPVQLTFDSTYTSAGDWSPDGNWIVFGSMRSGNWEIWKIRVGQDGSPIGDPIQLTDDPSNDFGPVWCPDNIRIAFCSDRSGNSDIWIMSHTGEIIQQVTSTPGNEFNLDWSPYGDYIVYAGPESLSTLAIVTDSLPEGLIGIYYEEQLLAEGGWPPYTWSLFSGSLPTGLSIDTNGLISGEPTSAESVSFLVMVTDEVNKTVTKDFSINIIENLIGDANGDNQIDILDVLAVVNHILGVQLLDGESLKKADCNRDEIVNILDALGIVHKILGIGDCPP